MACIHNAPDYRVDSFGNGLFVTITRVADNASVFLQGDEATDWTASFERVLQAPHSPESLDRAITHLCDQYDCVMQPAALEPHAPNV